MWPKKRILVPSDFSASSRRAGELAAELAQASRVPLTLMHVVFVEAIHSGFPNVPEYTQFIEDAARSAIGEEAARLQSKGFALDTLLKTGVAWEEIIGAAKRLDVGLIVMGTHGRRGLPRALLGSVTEKIVRLSPVPVLTVHAADDETAQTRPSDASQ